jgi:heme exporter protein A
MLEVVSLGCIRGERRLFRDVNFSLSPGSLLQVEGPNGSGKTSLLRMLCGLLAPAEGAITWRGAKIHSLGEEYSATIAYIGHQHGLKEELSAIENLKVSNGLAGTELDDSFATGVLKDIGLAGRENLPVRLLSEGQRRRAALARLMTSSASIWILDEVLAALDKSAVKLIKSLIESHLKNGGLAVIASHEDLNLASGSHQRLVLT